MSRYRQEVDVIRSLKVREGEHRRMDCPFCGHTNTLSLSRELGQLRWNCFSASCSAHGRAPVDMSLTDVCKYFSGTDDNDPDEAFELNIPDHWVPVYEVPAAMEYLQKNNCIESVYKRRVAVKYDAQQNRVVFLVCRFGKIFDATGRTLKVGVRPKWLRYGASNLPLFCTKEFKQGDACIVVEDAASAASASRVLDACALMGTTLSAYTLAELTKYKTVYIALDRDATSKNYTIQSKLAPFTAAKVVWLQEELKELSAEQIKALLEKFDGKAATDRA